MNLDPNSVIFDSVDSSLSLLFKNIKISNSIHISSSDLIEFQKIP